MIRLEGLNAKRIILVLLCSALVFLVSAGAAMAEPLPAPRYGGTVNDTNGNPVAWDAIQGWIAGYDEPRGELLKSDLGKYYTVGEYGLPLNDAETYLVVNCVEGQNCTNKIVTFKVVVGSQTYTAQTNPATVYWKDGFSEKRRVDLVITMTPPTGIKGNVFLEKIYPEDPEPNHQGTTVKVTQGGETFNATTNSSGYYEVTGLASGSCTVEFDNPGASWKKVTRSANVVDGALTTLPNVTLYIGDVDNSGTINLLDILWISNRLGPVSPGNPADINKDNNVNILDLLKVHKNINKN
jgi:hypothetical protein